MNFKKDYINYVLSSISDSYSYNYPEQSRAKSILGKIILADDLVNITFIIGKTAGLEILFKYLLYISDKIDKSQITIFNLKDNFNYDVENLKKICDKIQEYKSHVIEKTEAEKERLIEKTETKSISDETEVPKELAQADEVEPEKDIEPEKTEVYSEENVNVSSEEVIQEEKTKPDIDKTLSEETEEQKLTLIESEQSDTAGEEVFELTDISHELTFDEESKDEEKSKEVKNVSEELNEAILEAPRSESQSEEAAGEEEFVETEETPESKSDKVKKGKDELEIEIVTGKPDEYLHYADSKSQEPVKEEAVTNEAYNKFETKFFEEVKILEKLFLNVSKGVRSKGLVKLSDKLLLHFTEIIEISSELSNLTRQLSFDLTADIFLTINLFFTRAINNPQIITKEKIALLNSSLSLVNSLIKGENYLNYDIIVEKIEHLKQEMQSRPASGEQASKEMEEDKKEEIKQEKKQEKIKEGVSDSVISQQKAVESSVKGKIPDKEPIRKESDRNILHVYPKEEIKPSVVAKQTDFDTVKFKMKWLVRSFEKDFLSINEITGEYIKFDALEHIDLLNNSLRMIAKLSSSVRFMDVSRLAEVSYVFLKYLKDYRMDLLDPEIQQIVKYIIFTFKMLLTNRRPEDFNVLVQYLNNPVKIFTDS